MLAHKPDIAITGCPSKQSAHIFRTLAVIGALAGMHLDGKDFLREGERLYAGEYLTSKNEKYRMGINELGALEIVDIAPDPGHANLIPGWDGKTFWTARFTPWGIDPNTNHNFAIPRESYINIPSYWQCPPRNICMSHGDLMHAFKKPTDKRSYTVHGGKFLSLQEDDKFHHLALYSGESNPYDKNRQIELWSPPVGYTDDEISLLLEDCGRAIVISEAGLHWCSCPYCDDWPDEYGRGFKVDFFNFSNTKYGKEGVDRLGIPTHAQVRR